MKLYKAVPLINNTKTFLYINHKSLSVLPRISHQFRQYSAIEESARKDVEEQEDEGIENDLELLKSSKSFILKSSKAIIGGKTGDKELDMVIKRWRSTNTEDDERLKKILKRKKSVSQVKREEIMSLVKKDSKVFENENVPLGIEEEEEGDVDEKLKSLKNVRKYNPETGEYYGPDGPEPTRYGDWEKGGRCSDF